MMGDETRGPNDTIRRRTDDKRMDDLRTDFRAHQEKMSQTHAEIFNKMEANRMESMQQHGDIKGSIEKLTGTVVGYTQQTNASITDMRSDVDRVDAAVNGIAGDPEKPGLVTKVSEHDKRNKLFSKIFWIIVTPILAATGIAFAIMMAKAFLESQGG